MQAPSQTGWLESRARKAWFEFRANGLRISRMVRDTAERIGSHPVRRVPRKSTGLSGSMLLAESESALWASLFDDQTAMVAGKVQNLRVAVARLNGLTVEAGDVFSFWKAVGRPVRSRGFVEGRELREGCMIASVGGGLCQLSNALYSAALAAGMEIIERHAHSQVVQGSLAEHGRDATVFWNYLDLRFRSPEDFVVETKLTRDRLIVRFHGNGRSPAAASTRRTASHPMPVTLVGKVSAALNDCGDCGQSECVERFEPEPRNGRTAYLLDEVWPEFDRWTGAQAQAGDLAFLPMDGVRRKRPGYTWPSLRKEGVKLTEHRWLTLRRSFASRRLKAQGAQRQKKLLAFDAMFAQAYAKAVPYDIERLVVPIGMLAELWRSGVLGGRHDTVLMTRAPIAMLQRDLDRAAALHPDSPTLGDFRADEALVQCEDSALGNADGIVTPHAAVADFLVERYGIAATRLDWVVPGRVEKSAPGGRVLFPASALGRKGAYEVRSACAALDLEVCVMGNANEGDHFWRGVRTYPVRPAALFEDVGCVVLPAFVEHRPRLLLKACAAGIPVVCTPECGIPAGYPGVTLVSAGDAQALEASLRIIFSA